MKTIFTKVGWQEITTKNINVKNIHVTGNPIMTVKAWLDFNRKHPKIGRKRKTCDRCKSKWEKGSINIIFTDKGNKCVCDKCYRNLTTTFKS